MESALYEGILRHKRFASPAHQFDYSLFMVYLDLGELNTIFKDRWLWSANRPNVAWFRRADHYGDPRQPLDEAIRACVAAQTGSRPAGPIRLLTHLRYLGHNFNPVSFYYCYLPDGRTLDTVVAEVANTPWGERHMYVLPAATRGANGHVFKKAFHVSPFLPMSHDYQWRFGLPAEQLWVHMLSRQEGARAFEATMSLARRPMTGRQLARALALRPAMTVKVVAAIYYQALRLALRGAPFYAHPASSGTEHES